MSLRKPVQTVLDYNDSGNKGATSIVTKYFNLPQDTDEVILKVGPASVAGADAIPDVYLQTTDDGGTTWYDIAHIRPTFTVVSSTINISKAGAQWAAVSVDGTGVAANGSIITKAGASTLGVNQYSGLPVMDTYGRVQIQYSGTITGNDAMNIQVKTNSQANRA
jgi:hypothetical protein